MENKFDIGAKVRIKPGSSKHENEQGIIIRMGLGKAADISEVGEEKRHWVVDIGGVQEEIAEHDLELLAESEI